MCCDVLVYFVFISEKLVKMLQKSGKMVVQEHTEFDIFVASKIGSFKHIKYHTDATKNSKKCIENLVEIKSLQKEDSITCLEWGNPEQTEILIGKRNQQVQVYDTLSGFTSAYTADFAPGDIVGLGRYKRRLIAAVASGTVKIWSKKEEMLIDSGGKLDQMKVCTEEPTLFATGGEENDLKIWRIGAKEPVFSAKNLPNDWLQLRRPVWVSGLTFLSPQVAAVCSRYGYVRLYDSRGQRRPVINVEFEKMAATCIVPSFDERQILVGFGRGQLHQVDLRVGKPHKGYKGACGAIASIAAVPSPSTAPTGGRYIVSGSLDRHLRVHEYSTKELIYKQYLTSKLSAVLVQTASSTPLKHPPEELKEEVKEEDDMDTLFDNMETVSEKRSKKQKMHSEPPSKRAKPSTDGSTIELDPDHSEEDIQGEQEDSQENKEDAIKKLLRSTEKKKRKLEKKKKEKKAKSVFFNA